jgi:hypothetical protein
VLTQTEPKRKPALFLWALVCLASALPHLPYLWGYFFMDDFWHLAFLDRGDYIFSTWRVDRSVIDQLWYMSKPVFPQMAWVEHIQYYFRPVYLLFLSLDRLLFDYWAPGYHFHSQLWHTLSALLIVQVGRKLGFSNRAAFLAGTLFGLHPMAAESLGWISARCYLHLTAFLLLSLLAYFKWRESRRLIWLAAHIAAFLMALGSHEMAVVFPFVLLAADLWPLMRVHDGLRRVIRWHALPTLLIACAFLTWRIMDDGGPATWSMSRANFFTFKLFGPLAVSGYNLLHYLKLTLVGIPPVSFVYRDLPFSGLDTWPIWLLAAPLMAGWLWRWRSHPHLILLMWLTGMLTAILWMPPAGRYLYVVMPAAALLAARAISDLLNRPERIRSLAFIGLAIALLWWSLASTVSAYATTRSHHVIRDNLDRIVEAVHAHPQATDLYLMHIWPMMVSSPGVVPLLAQRPDLRVHLLTYSSTLYQPEMTESKFLATLTFPVDGKWFEPLNIETNRVAPDKLVLTSTPEGFFTGPATFGWNSQQLPQPPEGEIVLPQFSVRVGRRIGSGGVRSLLFTLPTNLDDPRNLFMEYREDRMELWTPQAMPEQPPAPHPTPGNASESD